MKVKLATREVEIRFKKYRFYHKNHCEKINTECAINCSDGQYNVKGMAYLFHLDQYDKVTGKKVALSRALGHSSVIDARRSLPIQTFTKAERTLIWQAFFKEFPIKKK